MPNLSTISLSWDTKRKLEKIKFDLENDLKKSFTWDEFFNMVEIKRREKNVGKD